MTGHEPDLLTFLAGDLDPDAAARFDEHLLNCEACWQAVREDRAGRAAMERLQQPAPGGLADRIRFAVELSAGPRGHRPRRWPAAATGLVVVLLLTGLIPLALSRGARTADPRSVAAVVALARDMPPGVYPARNAARTVAIALGAPLQLQPGGQRLTVQYYRVRGLEVAVARSDTAFAMPGGATGLTSAGRGMAWLAQRGPVGLYCLNGPHPVLIAAVTPAVNLTRLATALPTS